MKCRLRHGTPLQSHQPGWRDNATRMLLQPCSRLSRECSRWHCDCCCSVHSNDNTPPAARSEFAHNGILSVASLTCTATGRGLTYMDGHMNMHAFSFVPDQKLCKASSKALEAQAGNMHARVSFNLSTPRTAAVAPLSCNFFYSFTGTTLSV